jgi:hypothetical protein
MRFAITLRCRTGCIQPLQERTDWLVGLEAEARSVFSAISPSCRQLNAS